MARLTPRLAGETSDAGLYPHGRCDMNNSGKLYYVDANIFLERTGGGPAAPDCVPFGSERPQLYGGRPAEPEYTLWAGCALEIRGRIRATTWQELVPSRHRGETSSGLYPSGYGFRFATLAKKC